MATLTKYGSEFLVNTIALNRQDHPTEYALPNGKFVVLWTDASGLGGDAFESGIRGQVFNADGSKSGADFLANPVTTNSQRGPAIAPFADGRFVATWQTTSLDAGKITDSDIYARIFNADGTSSAAQIAVNTVRPGEQHNPQIATVQDGSFVVSWINELTLTDWDVKAQRFSNTGAKIGTEFTVNSTTAGEQVLGQVVAVPTGGFIVVWDDFSFSGPGDASGSAVRSQSFDANGAPFLGEVLINSTIVGPQTGATIAALPGGGFVAAFENFLATAEDPEGNGIRARIFPAAGAPGADFGVNTTTIGSQSFPDITALSDGRFLIVWQDASGIGGDTSESAIKAQVFTAAGVKDGDEVLVNTTTSGSQFGPAATTLADGRIVITWVDESQSPDDFSDAAVRAQILDPRSAAVNLVGTALGDEWVGTPLADTMRGNGGNDRLDGGDDTDTAIFTGASTAYTITSIGSDFEIAGPDGTDRLKHIEFAQFDDRTIALVPVVTLTGTPGNDTFTALPGNERIDAGGGIDTINFDFRLVDAAITFAGNKVIIDGPSGHTVLTGFEKYVFTDGTVDNNDRDPLVDDLFYYSQNHDVWNAHADADAHYHGTGWHEGRNPNAFFATDFYLALNVDVRRSGDDPLVQFDQSGWKEGRIPSPAFDPAAYLAANPDVKAAGVDPLAHFLANGAQEGRQPFALTELLAPNGFDYVFYLQHNPDVAAAGVDPFRHFETVGWKEGRNPNALFDTNGYLATYADVQAGSLNPLDHYNQFGWHEGRDPSVNFDTTEYLGHYADIAAAHINPLTHFLDLGIHEGRSAFADGVWG